MEWFIVVLVIIGIVLFVTKPSFDYVSNEYGRFVVMFYTWKYERTYVILWKI